MTNVLSRRLVVLWVAGASAALGCGAVSAKHVAGAGGASGSGGAAGMADAGPGDGTAPVDARGDVAADAPGDTGGGGCNPLSPFGTPALVSSLNSASREDGVSFTSNLLIAFISSFRVGSLDHIFTAARSAPDQPFGTPMLVTSVMGATGNDFSPRISADGLRLYFASNRSMAAHIYLATRTSVLTDFTAPALLAGVNSTATDYDEYVTSDEQTMVFASTRAGGPGMADLYVSQRTAGAFGAPTLLAEVSSTGNDFLPVLSDDRMSIYFGSNQMSTAAKGGTEIWVARRASTTSAFGAAQLVAELNSPNEDFPLWISPDACTLYFGSGPVLATDVYVATRGH